MKLQKTNKYTRRITAGLMSAIISASILTGCSANAKVEFKPTEIVEIQPSATEIPRDKTYFANYYKIDDEEVSKRLEDYDIKNKDAKWCMFFISTVVVQDKNNDYKVLQCIERHDRDYKNTSVYDLFTEEHLFDMPYVHNNGSDNFHRIKNVDFSQITNKSDYFNDKEIVEYGLSMSSSIFFASHFKYFMDKDGIEYNHPGFEPAYVMYSRGDFTKEFHTTAEIAECYVKTVPEECRVTSEELGLKSIDREERKYADYWKISEEEKQERLKELEIYKGDSTVNMSKIQTLILKDSNENYKILNTIMTNTQGFLEVYDVISGKYLFSINSKAITKYEDVNFEDVFDAIPYFEDKKFVEFGACFYSNDFLFYYIDVLSKRDGINYELPNSAIQFYLYPLRAYSTDELDYTINQIADCYAVTVPEEMQVKAKDLEIILEKEDAKVLVK